MTGHTTVAIGMDLTRQNPLPMKVKALPTRAQYEYVSVPTGKTFLWRMDDYPSRGSAWHHHRELEIHLIRHSSGQMYVGDHIGRFGAGQLVLLGRNLPHQWVTPLADGQSLPERDIVVQFEPDRLDRATLELPELAQVDALFARASRGVEFAGETAARGATLLETMGRGSGLVRLSLFLELLSLMAESSECRTLATEDFATDSSLTAASGVQLMDVVLDHIRKHHTHGLAQSEVASVIGMSGDCFSRFFKANLGQTFTEHLERTRVSTACKLLSETDLAVTDVCFESGYRNISMFNRAFRRRTGMTPSGYRKAARARSRPAGEMEPGVQDAMVGQGLCGSTAGSK